MTSYLETATKAIHDGNVEQLLQMLETGLDSNCSTEESTLLIEAIVTNKQDIVEVLLDYGADINKGSKWLVTPLCAAAATNNIAIAKLLLDRGCNIAKLADDRPVFTVITPLHYAIQYKNLAMADLLLKYGHNPNFPSSHRYYPIIEAIKQDCIGIVRLLLNTPSCITTNITALLGGLEYPPLYQALFIYHKYHIAEEILRSRRCLLIFMGDSYISLVLRRAFDNSFLHMKTTKLLLEAGCDMECRDRYHYLPFTTLVKANRTIFHIAAMKPIMLLFIQAGVYPNQEAIELLKAYVSDNEDEQFVVWLASLLSLPIKLEGQCRQYLRRYFGIFPKDSLLQLPLPQTLLNYITFINLRSFYG